MSSQLYLLFIFNLYTVVNKAGEINHTSLFTIITIFTNIQPGTCLFVNNLTCYWECVTWLDVGKDANSLVPELIERLLNVNLCFFMSFGNCII